jgi:hypothetical protein
MKALILVCGLLVITSSVVSGAPVPASKVSKVFNGFDAFHAHRQQAGISLAWTHTSATVTGFIIQHSWDGTTFNTIDQVAPDTKGWNNYHDDGALPGFNYYRIGAILSDGTIDYSDVECVRIVKRK